MVKLDYFLDLFLIHNYSLFFLGSFFGGDMFIFAMSFLAGQGLWSWWSVFLICFVGTIASDCVWFLSGTQILDRFRKYKFFKKLDTKYLPKGKPWKVLLIFKFLYGTRILTIIYFGVRKLSFLKFLILDSIGTLEWLAVIVLIGWLAGRGIANYINLFQNISIALTALLIAALVFKFGLIWFGQKLKKQL